MLGLCVVVLLIAIGGLVGFEPNTIAFNQGAGVAVISGSGVTARGNLIFNNGLLGIDLCGEARHLHRDDPFYPPLIWATAAGFAGFGTT